MIHDVQADLELAILAAREAGAIVMRTFRTEQRVTLKSPDQPLTDADLAADAALKRVLLGSRPDYGWLSEETADDPARLNREKVWIVDPIDGTRSYIAGHAEFSISIGLALEHAAVVGVIYNPATDEMFASRRGHGAWRVGGKLLNVGHAHTRRILAASRSEISAGEMNSFADSFDIMPMGSTAYKLAKVAAGDAQVFVSRGPKSEWDVCAGVLLVEEAGGRVTDLNGRPIGFNQPDTDVYGLLASNGALHAEMLAAIAPLPETERLREWTNRDRTK